MDEDLKDPLDRPVLAEGPVQGVEGDVGLQGGKALADVAADIDPRDLVALGLQRVGDGFAAVERHGPLGGPTSHQDGDVLHRKVLPRRDFLLPRGPLLPEERFAKAKLSLD